MLFMYLKHVISAGILSAALAIAPGAAFAQTSGSTSGTSGTSSQGTSSQGTSSQGTSSQGSSSQGTSSQGSQSGTATSSTAAGGQRQGGSGGSGADQEAVRQHLSAAREALAQLTKLPAASQLQGDQRQQVAQLIQDFNSFATATTDWRTKYDTVDRELDQVLGTGGSAAAAGAASGTGTATGATSGSASASGSTTPDAAAGGASGTSGAVGTSGNGGAGGALDPTIIEKLREVRTHLDGFEEASGDPTFVVEKIEKILDEAAGGASAGGAVGTSGSASAGASAGGSVTLTAAQVQELRRQLDTIKAAAKR
jgi:hypothetical protein